MTAGNARLLISWIWNVKNVKKKSLYLLSQNSEHLWQVKSTNTIVLQCAKPQSLTTFRYRKLGTCKNHWQHYPLAKQNDIQVSGKNKTMKYIQHNMHRQPQWTSPISHYTWEELTKKTTWTASLQRNGTQNKG